MGGNALVVVYLAAVLGFAGALKEAASTAAVFAQLVLPGTLTLAHTRVSTAGSWFLNGMQVPQLRPHRPAPALLPARRRRRAHAPTLRRRRRASQSATCLKGGAMTGAWPDTEVRADCDGATCKHQGVGSCSKFS
jgi:hypothetical protein